MGKKILITGASGLVGSRLTEMLLAKGYQVVHLGRNERAGDVPRFTWDIAQGKMDARALNGVDAVIHLAGAGVVDKRWNADRKKELRDSRIQSINLLTEELKKGDHQVKSFISASAIGYYGIGDDINVFTETDPPGTDFLAQLVEEWERASEKIAAMNIRVLRIRIGIVLSEKGGALKSMAQPIKMGFGSVLGTGRQYLSWVHLDDLCEAFIMAVGNDLMEGNYNVAGTQPVTNREMTLAIAKVLGKPVWLPPVPSWILKILLGEMAYIVTTGQNISSEKIQKAGFVFRYTNLDDALINLYERSHPSET